MLHNSYTHYGQHGTDMTSNNAQDTRNTSGRVFAYARVSTADQNPDNQLREIEAAGFRVTSQRLVSETISGSTAASQRPGFARLLVKLEAGDVLVVTKLDRLGRSAMDVRATVEHLASIGVRVHCLALGGADLTSAAGKMVMQVLASVAEFERDLLIERTQSGLARARSQGKKSGRPASLNADQMQQVCDRLAKGATVSSLAQEFGVSRPSILRARDRAAA